jgi:hypothetical protein
VVFSYAHTSQYSSATRVSRVERITAALSGVTGAGANTSPTSRVMVASIILALLRYTLYPTYSHRAIYTHRSHYTIKEHTTQSCRDIHHTVGLRLVVWCASTYSAWLGSEFIRGFLCRWTLLYIGNCRNSSKPKIQIYPSPPASSYPTSPTPPILSAKLTRPLICAMLPRGRFRTTSNMTKKVRRKVRQLPPTDFSDEAKALLYGRNP